MKVAAADRCGDIAGPHPEDTPEALGSLLDPEKIAEDAHTGMEVVTTTGELGAHSLQEGDIGGAGAG
jgi:hypothetical protein